MYETYPEYANLRVLKSDWGIAESAEALEAELDADWWAIVRREIPYSPHSDSHLVEVYVLVKKPYGKENFVAEGNGKILYVGQGRRRELVYGGQAGVGGAPVGRRFVIVETHPVKAFYLRHKGEGYRAFRYTTELHFQKDTRNKLDVQQFLQMHMADVHPVFTPAYFARLVELVKGEKDSAQAVQERLLLEFRKPIAAFKKLQAVENEERARMETQRRAQEEQDKRELEARAYTPPPQAEPSFVPPPAAFGAPPLPAGGPAPVPAPAPAPAPAQDRPPAAAAPQRQPAAARRTARPAGAACTPAPRARACPVPPAPAAASPCGPAPRSRRPAAS
eukprot:Rhum_TRINITY_DN14677_c10_g3::Rhum_TRINITY_DN14677_c10_g3_i1::g.109561::m.109561